MNNKAIIVNSAFVGYEEFCRSRRMLSTSASMDTALLDLQNSSDPTQPHSIIAKYLILRRKGLEPTMMLQQHQNVNHRVYFVGCNIPAKFQEHCFIIGGDILNFVSHHCI